jgi:integrase
MRSLRRAWVTACRKAGRPGLLPHDLRRSAVRNLEHAGTSRSVAITEAVYRCYAIVAESDPREAGAKLTIALGRGKATASLGDNLADNSGAARNGRSVNR